MRLCCFPVTVLLAVCVISLLCLPVAGTEIYVSSANLEAGETALLEISMDRADTGLAGYLITARFSDTQVAGINNAEFPLWATLKSGVKNPDGSLTLQAVDLNRQVEAGATNIQLASISINGVSKGTTELTLSISGLDDDDGNPIQAETHPGICTVTDGSGDDFVLSLKTGWNFVSVPMKLKSGFDTAAVFADVKSGGHSIFSYNDESGWISIGQYDKLNPMDAYWIFSEEETQIKLLYESYPKTEKLLSADWNIAGIPGIQQKPAKTAVSSLESWVYLIGFDAENQRYDSAIISGGSGEHSDEQLLVPGKGYWIYLTEDEPLKP